MAKIHLNIGSNIGNRAAQIECAVAAICRKIDPLAQAEIRLAPIVESEPWGFESRNSFLNLGMMIYKPGDVDPKQVLEILQTVEREISVASHRAADGSYVDRAIDIDLIAVDDKVVDDDSLVLPHPRMALRSFVLEPMACLDPDWRHPLTGLTVTDMLAKVGH